jgi:hypothetical protein
MTRTHSHVRYASTESEGLGRDKATICERRVFAGELARLEGVGRMAN